MLQIESPKNHPPDDGQPVLGRPAQLPGQAEYNAFLKKQGEALKAFRDQQLVERDAFLKNYPELAARIAEQEKAAKERADKAAKERADKAKAAAKK